jgi:pyruvate dehydrogenase E1 component beta subunit
MKPTERLVEKHATREPALTYNNAIREALYQAMGANEDVIVLGQLVDYKSGVFGTTTGLVEAYGRDRVQDFPVSEAAMNSVALGAALTGLRPVIVHQRVDFMIYSLDSIVNWLALWYFKSNGKSTVPVVIRAIIGKGWGQGPQHSKSLHAWFAHLPGLKVAMPATAYDAKGILLESIFGQDPCLILESRSLFSQTTPVPEEMYRVRYGQAVCRKQGQDVTIVAIGHLVPLAMQAASRLKDDGIDAEVIDLRTLKPLDRDSIIRSVTKTGRLVVADPGWNMAGFAAEVIATVSEQIGDQLKAKPVRVTFPDSHTPMTQYLESQFYPSDETIHAAVKKCLGKDLS